MSADHEPMEISEQPAPVEPERKKPGRPRGSGGPQKIIRYKAVLRPDDKHEIEIGHYHTFAELLAALKCAKSPSWLTASGQKQGLRKPPHLKDVYIYDIRKNVLVR